MESRCYHGKEGRTRVKVLRPAARDWYAVAALALLGAALIALRTGAL
jgi:energy-coupling factor transport system permease protein